MQPRVQGCAALFAAGMCRFFVYGYVVRIYDAQQGIPCGVSGGDERLHGADLIFDRLRGAGVEIFVIIRMVCQLVPFVYDALQRLRPAGGVDAVDEERRVHAAFSQTVEQVGGIFARAVVKRDGQQLRPAIQTFCLTNWGETGQNLFQQVQAFRQLVANLHPSLNQNR